MNKRKFVNPLTQQQTAELERLRDNHPVARTRDRAAGILLSGQGYSIGEIAIIFSRHRLTVSQWLDRWASEGIEGILEKPGRGKKKTFTKEEENQILAWRENNPRQLKPLVGMIETHIGKAVCPATVRNIILRSKAA